MPYSHIQWSALRAQLAARLGDSANSFWTDTECGVYLAEALRTFGILSAFWRQRGTFTATVGTAFYDLSTNLLSAGEAIVGYTVTDRDLIQSLQYHLLEAALSQSSWAGTEMFTLDDLTQAIQRRRDQFIADTGIVLTRSLVSVAAPPIGRQVLADTIMDVRRAVWLGASPTDYYTHLWREDERALTSFDTGWSVTPATPYAYSVLAPPPLQLQIAPPPQSSGQLDLITTSTGAALDPTTSATVLGVPDDLTPFIKWGALADLLGKDGPARDAARAAFAEQRYMQGVQLARMLPVVVHAELNGVPLLPCTLDELDAGAPNWQNTSGTPTDIAIAGANLVWIYPVPDTSYSVTLDVVRRSPVPTSDVTQVQIGREQVDMVLDYAEHLALFKVGGSEWAATARQATNFILQSITYNQRLAAAARYVITSKLSSNKEKSERPRRTETDGLAALPSDLREVNRG